jgi:GntR family transcriptional regulator, transcriptional repressor for pyruvate dehydrogenase complex
MADIDTRTGVGAQARTGVVDRIYREVLASIIAGEFREGDKLPTEIALTERFAASRPAIREALARLRADGVTVTRQGSGTVVQRRPDPEMPRFTPLENLSDVQRCFEFRIVIESGAAELAARKASATDMAAIEQSFRNLDTVIAEHTLGAREDFEFHLALARASHNQFFVSAIAQMQEQVMVSMNLMRNLTLTKSVGRQQVVQAEHAAIVAALRRHDGPGAGLAMRQHLENARNRMFGA